MELPLNEVAEMLKVHPRTVLRAIYNKENVYWAEGYNPEVSLETVAMAYCGDVNVLRNVKRERDAIYTPVEAAAYLKITLRLFRYRTYPKTFKRGNIVRYSRQELLDYHLMNYPM